MLKNKKNNKDSLSKSRNKRILTIYSSQASILEHLNSKNTSLPLKKISQKPSSHQILKPKISSKAEKSKKKNNLPKKSKDPLQKYQRIPMSFIQSNSNSEIQFSNCGQTRKEITRFAQKKNLYIDCSDEYLVKEIWNFNPKYRKLAKIQNEAATKIQKVFRGYLTRKLLNHYIDQYQRRLLAKKEQLQIKKMSNSQMYLSQIEHLQPSSEVSNSSRRFRSRRYQNQEVQISERVESLGNFFFPSSNKKRRRTHSFQQSLQESQEKSQLRDNPLDMESSIMMNQNEPFYSVNQNDFLNYCEPKPVKLDLEEEILRKSLEKQKSSLNLNESSFFRQPREVSLSFGQQNMHSPTFFLSKNERTNELVPQSFAKEPENMITQVSEDKIKQFQSQSISKCGSFSKNSQIIYEKQKDDDSYRFHSKQSSLKKQEQEMSYNSTDRNIIDMHLQRLRSVEKAKWQHVILMLNQQLQGAERDQSKTKNFMAAILQISVKNREQLTSNFNKMEDEALVTPTTVTYRQQQQEIKQIKNDSSIAFKKKKFSQDRMKEDLIERIQKNQEKVKKNQNMPLIYKMKQEGTVLERTENLKKFFLKNIKIQDDQIEKMMQFRQVALKKKESEKLLKLNDMLQNSQLDHDEFIKNLQKMAIEFQRQKQEIQQTKNQIYQGYKAQMELMKMTAIDARHLGYNLPFCRSMEIFPQNSKWRLDEVMIDELNNYARRKNRQKNLSDLQHHSRIEEKELKIKVEEEDIEYRSESQGDSVSFSCEQTTIYKKNQPYSFDIRSLQEQKNLENSGSILNSQRFSKFDVIPVETIKGEEQSAFTPRRKELYDKEPPQPLKDIESVGALDDNNSEQEAKLQNRPKQLKRQVFQIHFDGDSSSEEQVLYKQHNEAWIEEVISNYLTKVIWQFIEDLYQSKRIFNRYAGNISQVQDLLPITYKQKCQFLDLVEECLPDFDVLKQKLNQKMYPNTRQLLISMREELPDDEAGDELEYYQIGQYEYLLCQQICFHSIYRYLQIYKKKIEEKKAREKNFILLKYKQLEEQMFENTSVNFRKLLMNHQKLHNLKIQQNQQLRQEILKIQIHMILDSWNEQIVKDRENKEGYSGIGCNQLTLSLVDKRCKPIYVQEEFHAMMKRTKAQILESINQQQNFNEKILRENKQSLCGNDAQWIYYAHQALQYGFDLAKAVEIDLVVEFIKDLGKLCSQKEHSDLSGNENIIKISKDFFQEINILQISNLQENQEIVSFEEQIAEEQQKSVQYNQLNVDKQKIQRQQNIQIQDADEKQHQEKEQKEQKDQFGELEQNQSQKYIVQQSIEQKQEEQQQVINQPSLNDQEQQFDSDSMDLSPEQEQELERKMEKLRQQARKHREAQKDGQLDDSFYD